MPRVLEGNGFGIVDDCGGIMGLARLAEAFQAKYGEAYEEYSEWLDTKEFDLSHFDIDDMNIRLKKLPRVYKQIYEDKIAPTQRSIDLLERNK